MQAADAAADDHATAESVLAREIQATFTDRVLGADDGELCEAVDALGFLGRDVLFTRCPIGNFAAELNFEALGVEEVEGANAAFAAHQTLPHKRHLVAQRGDGPQAGDDDAPVHYRGFWVQGSPSEPMRLAAAKARSGRILL